MADLTDQQAELIGEIRDRAYHRGEKIAAAWAAETKNATAADKAAAADYYGIPHRAPDIDEP